MVLAIEADGSSYRQSDSVRDRDRLRSEHLPRLGWRFHRIWSTNWFRDPVSEVAKLQQAYDEAVSATILPEPEAAAEVDPEPVAGAATEAAAESTSTGPAPPVQAPAEQVLAEQPAASASAWPVTSATVDS